MRWELRPYVNGILLKILTIVEVKACCCAGFFFDWKYKIRFSTEGVYITFTLVGKEFELPVYQGWADEEQIICMLRTH